MFKGNFFPVNDCRVERVIENRVLFAQLGVMLPDSSYRRKQPEVAADVDSFDRFSSLLCCDVCLDYF